MFISMIFQLEVVWKLCSQCWQSICFGWELLMWFFKFLIEWKVSLHFLHWISRCFTTVSPSLKALITISSSWTFCFKKCIYSFTIAISSLKLLTLTFLLPAMYLILSCTILLTKESSLSLETCAWYFNTWQRALTSKVNLPSSLIVPSLLDFYEHLKSSYILFGSVFQVEKFPRI